MRCLLRVADWIDRLNETLGRWVAWLTLVMVIIASYNAIMSKLAKRIQVNLTSNALLELQWYLFSLVFLIGAAYTLKHNDHVRVDILYDRLGKTFRAGINLAGNLIFLIPFSIFVICTSGEFVRNSWAVLEQSADPGGLPRYPIKTLIPIAFILLILQGLANTVREIKFLTEIGKQHDDETDENTI